MLTNEQIARLIVDAYNAGKTDGYTEGYNSGYEDGDLGQDEADDDQDGPDFEITLEEDEDEEDEEGMSSEEVYDAGWNDGYRGNGLDLTMKEDRVYLWGYKDGKEESK
jgi:hypothetical protein